MRGDGEGGGRAGGLGAGGLRAGLRMGYPEQSPGCEFGSGPAGDLDEIVRSRHRAEAAEWLALFTVFREEADRLDSQAAHGPMRDAEFGRVEAAEAACARWCVAAPVTVASTRFRLKAAIQLFEHLPLVAEAFLDGVVSAQLIRQIVSRTYGIDPRLLAGVDAAIRAMLIEEIAGGARFSARAVDSAVDEIVMLIDPDGVRTVHKTARSGCRVQLDPLPGGVARILAILPAAAALMVFNRVDRLARRIHAKRPSDEEGARLTLDRCRSIALVLVVAGRAALSAAQEGPGLAELVDEVLAGDASGDTSYDASHDAPLDESDAAPHSAQRGAPLSAESCAYDHGGATVVVHATEDAMAQPAGFVPVWLPRVGLLPSEAVVGLLASARRIVPRAGPVEQLRPGDEWSWITTPCTPPDAEMWEGIRNAVPEYALRYRIPDWLAAKVRMRDGYCRFPGCSVKAEDCDVDHVRPFLHRDPVTGGWTIEANLGAMCRSHHRLKTHDGWEVTVDADAVFTFTSPDGTVAYTYPAGPATRIGLAGAVHGDEPPSGDRGRTAESGFPGAPGFPVAPGLPGAPGLPAYPGFPDDDPEPPIELLEAWALEDVATAELNGWDREA